MPYITACDNNQNKIQVVNQEGKAQTPPPFARPDTPTLEEARELARVGNNADDIRLNKIEITKNNGAPPDESFMMPANPAASVGAPQTLPQMAQAKGLKTQRLFDAPTKNDAERFQRLENVVQDLASKIENFDPAINRLMDIDRDLEGLTSQLEILIQKERQGTQAQAQEAAAPEPSRLLEKKSPLDASGLVISNIRIADHAGKTRIVLEANKKPIITSNFDASLQKFYVEVSNAAFAVDIKSLQRRSKNISQIRMMEEAGTPKIEFMLVKQGFKKQEGYLPPTARNQSHRYYIDLIE